jgi:hypothetical protein
MLMPTPSVSAFGVTAIDVGVGVTPLTTTVAVSSRSFARTLMRAVPTVRPVTMPVPVTDAIDGSSVDQVKLTPLMGSPFVSMTCAVSCVVPPTAEIVAVSGVTLV